MEVNQVFSRNNFFQPQVLFCFIHRYRSFSFYLLTWLTRRVCKSRSLPGRRLSQIRCWLDRTATPWQTQREHKTSKTWKKIDSFHLKYFFHAKEFIITVSYIRQYNGIYLVTGRYVRVCNSSNIVVLFYNNSEILLTILRYILPASLEI